MRGIAILVFLSSYSFAGPIYQYDIPEEHLRFRVETSALVNYQDRTYHIDIQTPTKINMRLDALNRETTKFKIDMVQFSLLTNEPINIGCSGEVEGASFSCGLGQFDTGRHDVEYYPTVDKLFREFSIKLLSPAPNNIEVSNLMIIGETTVVPEPSPAALIGVGILCFIVAWIASKCPRKGG